MVAHAFFARALDTPELEIDSKEAHSLSSAVLNVFDQYDFRPDPKTAAWINLGFVAGAIYAPRLWIIGNKPKLAASPEAPSPVAAETAAPAATVNPTVIFPMNMGRA